MNCVATIVVATAVAVVDANAELRRIQVGTLTCSLSAGIGLIVGSQRNVSCLFGGGGAVYELTIAGTDNVSTTIVHLREQETKNGEAISLMDNRWKKPSYVQLGSVRL